MSKVKKIIKHRSLMQTEKSKPSSQRIRPDLGEPRFRHYPYTLGWEFLGLHRKPMLDSIWFHQSVARIKKCGLESRASTIKCKILKEM